MEIDDYNSEYFFNGAEELEEYNSILDSLEYHSFTSKEKDMAYNIFSLEQAISILDELGKVTSELCIIANDAINYINKFIEVYTKGV